MDGPDGASTAMVVDGDSASGFLGCPECNTTRLMMPNLQLKFATCCGRCMCVHCIDNRFKSVKVWSCTLCHEQLKKTSWDVVPIEEQRFKTEVQHRQETNRIFTLESIDFPSLVEYNDYLETNADIIYSLTYGTKADAAAARVRLTEFQRANRTAIDKSKSRKFQEKADQERKERQLAGGAPMQMYTAPAPLGFAGNVPSFVLPVLDAAAPPSSVDEEKRLHALADPRERTRALWDLAEKRRMAGGFRREDDRKRSKQEACDGLFA